MFWAMNNSHVMSEENSHNVDASAWKMSATDRFMDSFDPGQSNREKRKANRKLLSENNRRKAILYDDKGRLLTNGLDLCDCLVPQCPGCHFPCPKCKHTKCGAECRIHRKTMDEEITYDGTSMVIKNEFLPKNSPTK